MGNPPFEDVFPIQNGDFHCYVSLPECTFSPWWIWKFPAAPPAFVLPADFPGVSAAFPPPHTPGTCSRNKKRLEIQERAMQTSNNEKNISIPILPYWFVGNPHIGENRWWSIAKKSNIPWYSKTKQPWSCFILRNWKYSDSSQQKCTCILYKILYLADVKNMGPNHKRKNTKN